MNNPIEVVSSIMELEAIRNEWDAPPVLAAITHDRGNYGVFDLRVPNSVWTLGGHPTRTMTAMRSAIGVLGLPDHLEPLRSAQLAGLVLFTEGWMLHSTTKEAGEEALGYAREHFIKDHPNRIEIKAASGKVDGERFGVILPRGSAAPEILPGATAEGDVYDAIDSFFDALLGATL